MIDARSAGSIDELLLLPNPTAPALQRAYVDGAITVTRDLVRLVVWKDGKYMTIMMNYHLLSKKGIKSPKYIFTNLLTTLQLLCGYVNHATGLPLLSLAWEWKPIGPQIMEQCVLLHIPTLEIIALNAFLSSVSSSVWESYWVCCLVR